ncbi:MAG: 5,10-methylenetetrahydrofolate reductase [Spirochaetia bacterium]|nr:5,10-methylenetetrahydrofolate reductase [Spirochaetia bacterium]
MLLRETLCPLLYSLTPPKLSQDSATLSSIAATQVTRISRLDIEGLILYDIQDETDRTDAERPFPFLPTIDPYHYAETYLGDLHIPKIIYRCVGKHTASAFTDWLELLKKNGEYYTVLVGAASRAQSQSLTLADAYDLKRRLSPALRLGGVSIPERHRRHSTEHLRMFAKQRDGCTFFVTQAVYDVQLSKDLLSDYYYTSIEQGSELFPIIFTFSICGSPKTLAFMKWLGVSFPKWLENELMHAHDIIEDSFDRCLNGIKELIEFSRAKQIPIGFNIESVSNRKEEIDASIRLVNATRQIIKSYG